MIAATVSFLQYYLAFFGERKFQFIDLLPYHEDGVEHLPLDARYLADKNMPPEEMERYVHDCWCNPELIYADDVKGNEVWLHKPVQ